MFKSILIIASLCVSITVTYTSFLFLSFAYYDGFHSFSIILIDLGCLQFTSMIPMVLWNNGNVEYYNLSMSGRAQPMRTLLILIFSRLLFQFPCDLHRGIGPFKLA